MLRPSSSASWPVARVPVAPRLVTLMSRAETWVTLRPGTERNSSAKFCVGTFSMCCAVMTLMVAGAFTSFCSVFEPVTTTVSSYFVGGWGSSGFGGSFGFCCVVGGGVGGCAVDWPADAGAATAAARATANTHRNTDFI